jgi:hypothetical protein
MLAKRRWGMAMEQKILRSPGRFPINEPGARLMKRVGIGVWAAVLATLSSGAEAGMPSVTLSDFARIRVEAASFFLVGLLLAAAVVLWCWNALAADFPRLPKLRYRGAVGIVVLWGLLFVIVLTMISGARELMTPGAWVRQGMTYKLTPLEDRP